MKCENCKTEDVPEGAKKFCSRRCKHQSACRAYRARKAIPSRPMAKAHVAAIVKEAQASVALDKGDGETHACIPVCRHCKAKPATHGRGFYCSDDCRIKAARAGYIARQAAKA